MNRNIYTFLSLLILISSCATLKKSHVKPDQLVLTPENISQLNGTYQLVREEPDSIQYNIDDLSWILLVHGNIENGDRIQLAWEHPNRLQVKLLKDSVLLETRVFKGKIKNGYLVLRRKIQFIPIIVFTMWRNRNVRLGMLESGELVVDSKIWMFGLSLMIPIPIIDVERIYGAKFKKQKL